MMRAPGLAAPRTKPPRSAAVAAGRTAMRALPATKWLFLMPSPRRGEAGTVSTAIAIRLLFGSVIWIGEAAAPALGLAAATIVALIDLDQAVERVFRSLAQPVAQLVRHQPGRVVAQRQFARQEQSRHAALVLADQPCRGKPFAQRRAGAVKHRPGGHRMLPPAVGTFENPRSNRELISQPPGAPDADEPVGPTQLRQCSDARRLIPIAIHECEKSGHHRPLPPSQDRRRIRAQREHIKNIATHPALTGEGSNRDRGVGPPKVVLWVDDRPDNNIFERAAMEKYNVQFVLANSTEEAIAKLSSAPFDAIISDMGRPPDPRAGCTLLQAVRSRGNQSHILFTPDRELLSMWWSRCAAGPKGQQTYRRNSSRW